MKILIISGFLGAGKTTFIGKMAERTGKSFVILENEYGGTNIDSGKLKDDRAAGAMNIWEMTEGCICCSMKEDLAASVLTIANALDPEYLIIEPTGVGKLSSIVENLKRIEYERISILAPVAVVDGLSYWRYVRDYEEIYRDQISTAGTIFLSKMESALPEERSLLERELRKLNEHVEIRTEHYSHMSAEEWDKLLTRGYDGTSFAEPAAEETVLPDTLSMRGVQMDRPELLILLLERIAAGRLGMVIRAKGCIRAGECALRFDLADGRYSITGTEDGQSFETGKAVFIGTDIQRREIQRYFEKEPMTLRLKKGNAPEKNGVSPLYKKVPFSQYKSGEPSV